MLLSLVLSCSVLFWHPRSAASHGKMKKKNKEASIKLQKQNKKSKATTLDQFKIPLSEHNNIDFKLDFISTFKFKKITRIKNLTPLRVFSDERKVSLSLDHYFDGFWVQREKSWKAGLGPAFEFFFDHSSSFLNLVSFKVGLAPIKGKTIIYSNTYPDKETYHGHKPVLPKTAAIAMTLVDGDSVFFTSTGGMLFKAQLSSTLVDFGKSILTLSKVNHYIRKLGEHKIFISQTHGKIKQATLFISNIAASLTKDKIKEYSEGLSFIVDLTDHGAARAYEDMLHGNLVPMQEMAADAANLSVIPSQEFNSIKKSKVKSRVFDLIFYRRGKLWGKSHVFSTVKNYHLKNKTISHYGTYTKEKEMILGKGQKYFNHSFVGGISHTDFDNINSPIQQDTHGSFYWFYEDNKTKTHDIKKIFLKFQEMTRIDTFSTFYLEEKVKKLGYLNLDFKFVLKDNFINALLERIETEGRLPKIEKSALLSIDHYIQGKTAINYCKNKNEKCKIKLINKMTKEMDRSIKALQKMSYYKGLDRQRYVQEFIKFGKSLWKNPFLFKAFYDKSRLCGGIISLEFSGERIEMYKEKKETSYQQDQCTL